MGKYKYDAKYNIISMRVTDEEKAALDEMKHNTKKTVSVLMREAMQLYTSFIDVTSNR